MKCRTAKRTIKSTAQRKQIARKVPGIALACLMIVSMFGISPSTASATDYEWVVLESGTVFRCQNCTSYKVVTDPWNYPNTTALCYVHEGQYYAWTEETYGGWRKIWVAPYSNGYKGTTGWIYEGTYWARETKTVLRAKTTLTVYTSPGSGPYGMIYSGQKYYYLDSSGDWFKIQMCGDTAGGGAMQGWVDSGDGVQNDCDTGGDAGDSLSEATPISAVSCTGYIDETDTDDYYKVSVSSGDVVNVDMTPPSGSDFDLKLYDTNQTLVDSSTLSGDATDSVTYTATASGYFYIRVYRYSGSGTYSMTVEFPPPPPPDLTVIGSVIFSPSSAYVGDTISVTFTVKNQGGSSSGSFYNRVSLATTEWGTDYSLGNFPMGSLGAGESITVTFNTNPIPSVPCPADYYVTVFTDGFQEISESDEYNNIGSSTPYKLHVVYVPDGAPDTSITSGPPEGETITYNDVTFYYTGSDDVTPTSSLVYSYKLEGYDSAWSSYTSSTSKSYYDLPNGPYTFKVKAKDGAGNVDPSPASRYFTVYVPDAPQVTTNAASGITTTSATLNGNLDSTGGLGCQVWFEYGTSTSYGYSTTEVSKSSAGSFSEGISDLDPGTTYHFRSIASNSAGISLGNDLTFTTKPENPFNLDAKNPTTNSIYLTWTKGSGADKTVIRRKTGSYPSSPSDGVQAYFGVGTLETDSGLNLGTKYYYRAWAYDSDSGYYSEGYSQDYETTLEEITNAEYSLAEWIPTGNKYTRDTREIRYIVIHYMDGSLEGTIEWFENSESEVSAHYLIGNDGQIVQMVKEKDIAWHAGSFNEYSIGIEHEDMRGGLTDPNWATEEMYQSSAALVRYLCDKYAIPKDRSHILGHNEVSESGKPDPGPYWDWDYYMQLVTGTAPSTTPSEDAFNYQGEYELDWNELRNEERDALSYVIKYAREYDVSPALIMAIIRQESNFDPNAISSAGAVGYMQVTYPAALDGGYGVTEEQWLTDGLDPDIAIKYGTKYLRILYGRYVGSDVYSDSLKNILSAYYSGHPTKDSEWYVNQVIDGRDIIDGKRRGYEFFLTIRTSPNQSPVANAGPSRSENSGDIVLFDGSGSYDPEGGELSYYWDFGDNENAEGEKVTHRFRGAMNENKTYTVTLTVEDDSGAMDNDTTLITVMPLEKSVEVSHAPGFAIMRVSYNWVDTINGEDIYIVSKIESSSVGFTGGSTYFILDTHSHPEPTVIWWAGAPVTFLFGFKLLETSPFPTREPSRLFPNYEPRPMVSFIDEDFLEGIEVYATDVMSVRAAGIPPGVGKIPIPFFKENSTYFKPDSVEVPHIPIDINDLLLAHMCSPSELRVYDSQGRITGLVNGEVKKEIPYSDYENNTVVIFLPSDSYEYEVAGTEEGTYGLIVASVENEETSTLTLTNVPTSASAVHQYTVDWNTLAQGEKGVTMLIDSDGDGTFEKTVNLPTMEEITPPVRIIMPDLVIVESPQDLPEFVRIAERFEVRLMNVVPETPFELRIENSKFTRVWIDLKEARENVTTTIEKLEGKPPELPDPLGLVWAYHEISMNLPEDAIENAEIDFWVPKEWLTTHGVSKENVRLLRFGEGWEELTTEILEENTTHVSYRAITPGFSVFAITAYTPAEAPPEEMNMMLVGALVAAVVVLIVVVMGLRKRRRLV